MSQVVQRELLQEQLHWVRRSVDQHLMMFCPGNVLPLPLRDVAVLQIPVQAAQTIGGIQSCPYSNKIGTITDFLIGRGGKHIASIILTCVCSLTLVGRTQKTMERMYGKLIGALGVDGESFFCGDVFDSPRGISAVVRIHFI